MSTIKIFPFTKLALEEKEMILKWRNNPVVRQQMVDSSIIPIKSHLEFIENLSIRKDRLYYLVKENGVNLGVISIVDIKENHGELGLYKNPDINQGGVGKILLNCIMQLALSNGISRLKLKVKRNNPKALHLYIKTGFTEIKEDSTFIYMEKEI